MKVLKRKYTAPNIINISIDREICLVMSSNDPGGDPELTSAPPQSSSFENKSFQENPFNEKK